MADDLKAERERRRAELERRKAELAAKKAARERGYVKVLRFWSMGGAASRHLDSREVHMQVRFVCRLRQLKC